MNTVPAIYINFIFCKRSHMKCAIGSQQNGNTALIFAAENGSTDCVRLLLKGGADTNAMGRMRERKYNADGSEQDADMSVDSDSDSDSEKDYDYDFGDEIWRVCTTNAL